MYMPFGKYKGYLVSQLESGYLVYCLDNFNLTDSLRTEMASVLMERYPVKNNTSNAIPGDVKAIFRKLALKYHPDREGGHTVAMTALNEFYEQLKAAGG